MAAELDLNFLPFHRSSGKDWPSLPGLMTVVPPRRAARSREGDRLFVYLSLAGNTPISNDEYTKVIDQMTGRFYETPGSLTAALRVTADLLNQTLLNRNLGATGKGQYILGRLVLGVLRGRTLLIVQSGPTHFFRIGKEEVQHLHDPDLSGRGLGFSQTTPLYYFQTELEPGDHLVMSSQLPEGWESALVSDRGGTSLEALRRKLQAISNENVHAVVIQVLAGKGAMNLRTSTPSKTVPPPREIVTPTPVPEPEPVTEMDMEALRSMEEQSRQQMASFPEPVEAEPQAHKSPPRWEDIPSSSIPVPVKEPDGSIQYTQPSRFTQLLKGSTTENQPTENLLDRVEMDEPAKVGSHPVGKSQVFDSSSSAEIPEIKRPKSSRRPAIMGSILAGMQGMRRFGDSIKTGFKTLVTRILPGTDDGNKTGLQGSTMAFIAVIVPLMVVVIASTVYMKYGRSAQYDENYKLAISSAVGAIGQSDPNAIRQAWEQTIGYLNEADKYLITQDSASLRQQAESTLDAMDMIIRLDFRPAINGGLSKTVQIHSMAANETDLYLLNNAQGNVMRAVLTSQGYEVDPNFVCGPGNFPSKDESSGNIFTVGNILDMVALPRINPFGATLLGMDGAGHLLFCNPNMEPTAWKLEEPNILWKGLSGFALGPEDNALYVLDPSGNAVWVYAFNKATRLYDSPELFFSGGFVPRDMPLAIDIAITGTDLYLLFKDGHVTNCTPGMGDVVPIRCNDPETMRDTRAEGQSGPILPGVAFTSLTFTSPPDPSLYMLEPSTASIFRFSPRPEALFMQNQFRAARSQEKNLVSTGISALAISNSPNRYIFLCVGNQIYFATDVP